jgi:hypothetical protein
MDMMHSIDKLIMPNKEYHNKNNKLVQMINHRIQSSYKKNNLPKAQENILYVKRKDFVSIVDIHGSKRYSRLCNYNLRKNKNILPIKLIFKYDKVFKNLSMISYRMTVLTKFF